MSKRKTHYLRPMTMGRSICHVGKSVVLAVGGGTYKAVVHGSTVDLVETIEETTCKLCRKIFWRTKDGNPPKECLCVGDANHTECPVHQEEP